MASVVNFLPPDFPLPTSDPFEGLGDRARGEEGAPEKEGKGANSRNMSTLSMELMLSHRKGSTDVLSEAGKRVVGLLSL